MREFNKLNLTWHSGDEYDEYKSHWAFYREETCYLPLRGRYDKYEYCKRNDFTIIEFEDVEFDEPRIEEQRKEKIMKHYEIVEAIKKLIIEIRKTLPPEYPQIDGIDQDFVDHEREQLKNDKELLLELYKKLEGIK